jgi:HD-GYP domain-containing protein (c-di-GMP phosphodiesterase class II)
MTDDAHNWEPISADELRVGHYIKIDHHWFDHPFVRNIFELSKDEEIEIIRSTGLTRLYVDHARSHVATAGSADGEGAGGELQDAATEVRIEEELSENFERIQEHREALEEVSTRYTETVVQTRALLSLLNAADSSVKENLDALVDSNVDALLSGASPLALVDSEAPWNTAQRNVLLGIDAVGICGGLGKQMGLEEKDLRTLTHAASVHLVGLNRLPPALTDETPEGGQSASPLFRRYPELSARIVVECGGFSPEVIRVVREHRELPDGSGFPYGLKGNQIHPLALILGAVRTYQVLCSGEKAEPAQALAHMYRNMRNVYGAKIINNLVSTLTVYPPGSFVQLSDGSIGRVLRVNEDSRMRPVVGVVKNDLDVDNTRIVDLSLEDDLQIVRLVSRPLLPPKLLEKCRSSWTGMAITRQASGA